MKLADTFSAFLFRHRLRGGTRFHQAVLRGRRIEAKSKHGVILQLDPYEYIDGFVLREGFYEEEVLQGVLAHLRPGEVFWDIGSNLGLHALTVKRMRPDARVYAFEPNPRLAALIAFAGQRNSLEVGVMELALDAQAGRATFFVHEGNCGRSGLHNWQGDPDLKQIEVTTETADRMVGDGRVPAPHVVKMDVEGNEPRVIEGMRAILRGGSLHTMIFEDSTDAQSPAKQVLREAGFSVEPLTRREDTHHDLENYLARKSRTAG